MFFPYYSPKHKCTSVLLSRLDFILTQCPLTCLQLNLSRNAICWSGRSRVSDREEKMCVCETLCVILIPMKSRFLNPGAQADTLNKIILIPHGKRNENEEINVWGAHPPPVSALSLALTPSSTPSMSSLGLKHFLKYLETFGRNSF